MASFIQKWSEKTTLKNFGLFQYFPLNFRPVRGKSPPSFDDKFSWEPGHTMLASNSNSNIWRNINRFNQFQSKCHRENDVQRKFNQYLHAWMHAEWFGFGFDLCSVCAAHLIIISIWYCIRIVDIYWWINCNAMANGTRNNVDSFNEFLVEYVNNVSTAL